MGKVGMLLRVAVTGAGQSPALDVTVHAIGKSRSVDRINKALAFIAEREGQASLTATQLKTNGRLPCRFFGLLFRTGDAEAGKKTANPFPGQQIAELQLFCRSHQL